MQASAFLSSGRPVVGSARPNLPSRAACCRPVRLVRLSVSAAQAAPPAAPKTPDVTTRQYRRTVYDFALWTKHRQVNRYLYNLATMPGSRIIRTLMQPISVLLAAATLMGLYETGIEQHILPEVLPKFTLSSAEPAGLTSFAVSLLLVFRTNSSYGRFDEARKIWGGILNRARAISNQAITFIPAEDKAGREAVAKWTIGFMRALQAHLQEDADLRVELQKATPKWTEDEINMLVTAQHRPNKAISVLSELTRQLKVDAFQALQMQENVTFFYDALGGCERLLRTPLPLSYTRHTSRVLTLWLLLLPLGLWERYHWMMLPVIFSIAVLLLGIDEIGVQIEEPFGILPLDAICNRAQTDANSLVNEDKDVKKYVENYKDKDNTPLAGRGAAYPNTSGVMVLAAVGNDSGDEEAQASSGNWREAIEAGSSNGSAEQQAEPKQKAGLRVLTGRPRAYSIYGGMEAVPEAETVKGLSFLE